MCPTVAMCPIVAAPDMCGAVGSTMAQSSAASGCDFVICVTPVSVAAVLLVLVLVLLGSCWSNGTRATDGGVAVAGRHSATSGPLMRVSAEIGLRRVADTQTSAVRSGRTRGTVENSKPMQACQLVQMTMISASTCSVVVAERFAHTKVAWLT